MSDRWAAVLDELRALRSEVAALRVAAGRPDVVRARPPAGAELWEHPAGWPDHPGWWPWPGDMPEWVPVSPDRRLGPGRSCGTCGEGRLLFDVDRRRPVLVHAPGCPAWQWADYVLVEAR